jgi:leucyl aminopeptidase
MKFSVLTDSPLTKDLDVLIVFTSPDSKPEIKDFPQSLGKLIHDSAEREGFADKKGEYLLLHTKELISAYSFLVAGIDTEKTDLMSIQMTIGKAFKRVKSGNPVKVGMLMPECWMKYDASEVVSAVVEDAKKATYQFNKYKSDKDEKKKKEIDEVILFVSQEIPNVDTAILKGEKIADGINFARDLINEPADVHTPAYLAQKAEELVSASKKAINLTVWDKEKIIEERMMAFWGVAKGSDELPKFIRLEYAPKNAKKTVVIIGKGITFDSGGLSLKPAEHMMDMKMDMSGAAAVLGTFSALPILAPDVRVIGLIAACENMPSGKAVKPGDIVRARNGKTIEVLNTDAEGRLTLADMLSYAVEQKPDAIVDLATLTGACMIALGQDIAGLWSSDDTLAEALQHASADSAEKIWRMPLEESYMPLIKSHIADFKNIPSTRYGGAVTAALFLKQFVDDTPWAHLDIAGPAYVEKNYPLFPPGASGFGVGMLLRYICSL